MESRGEFDFTASYPVKMQKMLLLVMIRAVKPFVLTAGPTIELNLETCSTGCLSNIVFFFFQILCTISKAPLTSNQNNDQDNIETSYIDKINSLSTLFEIAGSRTRDVIAHTSAASLGQRATLSRRPVFVCAAKCPEREYRAGMASRERERERRSESSKKARLAKDQ
uniref:Uncharacterized protein n=1 Tax=Trichogramma kaykai TaxID=54128 RepID=A0ABD2XP43_9HYME